MPACIVHVMSPTNALAALCAVEATYADRLATLGLTVVVHYPHGSDLLASELTAVISVIVSPFAYVRRVVSLPQSAYDRLPRSPGHSLPDPAALRAALGVAAAESWMYAHDVSGDLAHALAAAYPRAATVCFGDALGQVFQRDFHLAFLGVPPAAEDPPVVRRRGLLARLGGAIGLASPVLPAGARRLVAGSLVPSAAVLILPVDQSGDFLPRTRLIVCPKPVAAGVFARARAACADLNRHIAAVMESTRGQERSVLLAENWAEGGTIAFEREVELLCDIVVGHCPPGSTVLVKTHPGEVMARVPAIADRLGGSHRIIGLDRGLQRYPIELWQALVCKSNVIGTMYPVLSLKFLYDIDVIQPMDDAFIERWFAARVWDSYKNALALNMIPLARLAAWDGRGALYTRGHAPTG